MTDDELERALFALSLEEPPADLRHRILVATVYRPRLTFKAWEVALIGTVAALMVWLSILVMTGVPNAAGRVGLAFSNLLATFGTNIPNSTWLWLALGISSTIWISQLSLMPARRQFADH